MSARKLSMLISTTLSPEGTSTDADTDGDADGDADVDADVDAELGRSLHPTSPASATHANPKRA